MDHATHAAELFTEGYNCAQAVAAAFADLTGIDEKTAARTVSGFGGGFGRLREVCGAVSGMTWVVSILYGYDDPNEVAGKAELYTRIQQLAGEFQENSGSIICREILKDPSTLPTPEIRTPEYYASRPCARMVYTAAAILERYIAAHPVK